MLCIGMSQPRMVSPARTIAVHVLHRVDRDEAWAAPTLDAKIGKAGADPRDSRLATTIVYGTLRCLPTLDAWISTAIKKKSRIDPFTRATLRASAFQLQCLERVPTHAVVDDAVTLVRNKRGQRLAGFVNAVLRRLSRERPEYPKLPTELVVPDWMHRGFVKSLGEARAKTLLELPQRAPAIHLRTRSGAERKSLMNEIQQANPDAEVCASEILPNAIYVRNIGDPRLLPGYEQGLFAVQDEGSQWVLQLFDAQPGESVADVCAGRGGKTIPIAKQVGGQGRVVAIDLHEHRLDQIPVELKRLGVEFDVERTTVDMSVGVGGLENEFDRVLVDAPCTGLGTIRRRPEIMGRLKPEDVARMAKLQQAILNNAAQLVRPGGTLMYTVCSPMAEEGEAHQNTELPGFRLMTRGEIAENIAFSGDSRVLKWGPWVAGSSPFTDAFQVLWWVHVG